MTKMSDPYRTSMEKRGRFAWLYFKLCYLFISDSKKQDSTKLPNYKFRNKINA